MTLPPTVQQACERLAAHCNLPPLESKYLVQPESPYAFVRAQGKWDIDHCRMDADLSLVAFHFLRAAGFLKGAKDARTC